MRTRSILLAGLAWLVGSDAALAATFWVVNHNDSGPGSLRQAILDMNAATGNTHQVRFDLAQSGEIRLASVLPLINKPDVQISGFKSATPVVIVGQDSRVFATGYSDNRDLSISWLEIRDTEAIGVSGGACISAITASGDQPGSLRLTGVTLRNCRARSDGDNVVHLGGGVHAGNRHLTITYSLFENNEVDGYGGAVHVKGESVRVDVTINNTTFLDNGATDTDAGAGLSPRGGALSLVNVALDVSDSRFLGNWTSDPDPDASHTGAAIHATAASARIANSLFLGHHSDAHVVAINNAVDLGPVVVENSQFIGNEVGRGSNLLVDVPRVIVRNSLVVGTTTADYFRPTGIFHFHTAELPGAGLSLHNNVLVASDYAQDRLCGGASGLSHNSQGDNQVVGSALPGCNLIVNASLAELAIDALRDHGGPVETVSLFAGSSAIDAGNAAPPNAALISTCLPEDARGLARPQAGSAGASPRCDAGAWESQGEPPLFRHDFEVVLWRP